jgi:hypothetical protein
MEAALIVRAAVPRDLCGHAYKQKNPVRQRTDTTVRGGI